MKDAAEAAELGDREVHVALDRGKLHEHGLTQAQQVDGVEVERHILGRHDGHDLPQEGIEDGGGLVHMLPGIRYR